MRLIIKFGVFLAVVFCAFWALNSYLVSNEIAKWQDARRAEGWQARIESTQGGFPFNISTKFAEIDLTNPRTGDRFSTQGAVVNARTYWPGHVDIVLPDAPLVLSSALQRITFAARDGIARLRLRAGLALEAREVAFDAGPWTLAAVEGDLLRGDAVTLRATQSARGSGRYDFVADLAGFGLGANVRQMLSLPQALPQAFDVLTAKGAVVFNTPVYPRTAAQTPPQFRQIILDGAQVDWGGVALRAMGAVDVDASGVPSGEIELQARDWRNLLDVAQAAGVLPSARRGQAELMFSLLAARGGSADDLDLVLAFEGGQMTVSGLPLGPAPNLTLRPYRQ